MPETNNRGKFALQQGAGLSILVTRLWIQETEPSFWIRWTYCQWRTFSCRKLYFLSLCISWTYYMKPNHIFLSSLFAQIS